MTEDEIIDAIRARVAHGRPTSLDWAPDHGLADEADIIRMETVLDHPFPSLARRIYLEVANGGVGPFGGIEGADHFMVEGYLQELNADVPAHEPPPPPAGVFFFCDFGCAIWALLDCRTPGGQMWWWEEGDRHKLDMSLSDWFVAWLDGRFERDGGGYELMRSLSLVDDESWCHDWCWTQHR